MVSFRQFLSEMAMGVVKYDNPKLKALGSQKLNNQFAKVLERHADFTFNFVFCPLQPHDMTNRSECEARATAGVKKEGAITVVLTNGVNATYAAGQEGGPKSKIMPLTAWTRIHRGCHWFVAQGNIFWSTPYKRSDTVSVLEELFNSIKVNIDRPRMFFKFASAQSSDSGTDDIVELYREIMTDYIWNGGTVRTTDYFQERCPGVDEKISAACHEILSEFVGKVGIEHVDFR